MKKYQPKDIEQKWQEKWSKAGINKVDLDKDKNPFYLLVELPYSSGDLHIGHWFAFSVPDIYARFKSMQGYNVFYPIGFDAFGLPAENAAIKRNLHPRDWTLENIKTMSDQFQLMGSILDFDHVVITCMPEYYRWNQWIFLKMLEKGIAYKGKKVSNWCPVDQTVLADEQVVAGHCDRCGSEIEQKEIPQWLLRITSYADRLEWTGDEGLDWPKSVIEGQNSWIGKSQGVKIEFPIEGKDSKLEVFTTRPDTLFGVTFMVISPEHPLLAELTTPDQAKEVKAYVEAAAKKNEQERKEEREKTGVFTGSYAKNPLNNEKIPIWVADYVLMSYGTGAIMAVPAHDSRDFEFATKYKLDIKQVVANPKDKSTYLEVPYEYEGVMVNSGEYNGLTSNDAREKISKYIERNLLGQSQIQYHLHDWSISRQRYWGTPIPIINCEKCGVVPVPEKDLPVELPYEVDFRPQGKPPLASNENWLKVKCPRCGGDAEREPETMDGFVDNSWYMYRYLSPEFNEAPFDPKLAEKWMPMKVYFGGAEHTLGHTLYSRFFTKFFHDLGLVSFDEYAYKRINHGVILGPDGNRMSKSKGNVINPDEQVAQYGSDTIRIYLSFIGPYDIVAPWNPGGINGVYHFLQRIWNLSEKVENKEDALDQISLKQLHKTIDKITKDLENTKFNTSVATLMEYLNFLSKKEKVAKEEYKTLLKLLAPFAPHMTEELWQTLHRHPEQSEGSFVSIHQQEFPKALEKYLEEDSAKIIVQINGRVRDEIIVDKNLDEESVKKIAMDSEKVKKFIGDNTIKKTIYVPGKIINLVV